MPWPGRVANQRRVSAVERGGGGRCCHATPLLLYVVATRLLTLHPLFELPVAVLQPLNGAGHGRLGLLRSSAHQRVTTHARNQNGKTTERPPPSALRLPHLQETPPQHGAQCRATHQRGCQLRSQGVLLRAQRLKHRPRLSGHVVAPPKRVVCRRQDQDAGPVVAHVTLPAVREAWRAQAGDVHGRACALGKQRVAAAAAAATHA